MLASGESNRLTKRQFLIRLFHVPNILCFFNRLVFFCGTTSKGVNLSLLFFEVQTCCCLLVSIYAITDARSWMPNTFDASFALSNCCSVSIQTIGTDFLFASFRLAHLGQPPLMRVSGITHHCSSGLLPYPYFLHIH